MDMQATLVSVGVSSLVDHMQHQNNKPDGQGQSKSNGCGLLTWLTVLLGSGGIASLFGSSGIPGFLQSVTSGQSTCPINAENIRLRINNKNLKEGEKTNISFEIIDPNNMTKDLIFNAEWKSSLGASIKYLDERGKVIEYTALDISNIVKTNRLIDSVTVSLEDSTSEKCSSKGLQQVGRIEISRANPIFKPEPPYTPFIPSPGRQTHQSSGSPTDTVNKYFAFIRQGIWDRRAGNSKASIENFREASYQLTDIFLEDVAGGFESFWKIWIRCGLDYEPQSVLLVREDDLESRVQIIFEQPRCKRRTLYEITLVKEDGQWLITKVEEKNRV